MAKKKNVVTGEIEDISDDEMLNELQSGNGIVKQTVTLPDGTQREMAVWGGYEYDGFDRTLNVFINSKDLLLFGKKMAASDDQESDHIDETDPCEYEKGIQITVDFLDLPETIIVRRGDGKFTSTGYARDERKSYADLVEEACDELDLEEDGSLIISREILDSHRGLTLAFVIMFGLREYLLNTGVVKQLYDMFDESAGVVVKVNKNEKITTKIVRGRERPNLPCRVFLMGDQMCRPYIDEILGLKSPAMRKPKDPELVAKMQAEKESRAKRRTQKELADKKISLTLNYRKIIKLQNKIDKAENTLKSEKEKFKAATDEVSAIENEYRQIKDDLQNSIETLENQKKTMDNVHDKAVSVHKSVVDSCNTSILNNKEEAKKIQALYEVKSEMLEIWNNNASKRGHLKKKNTAVYEEKQKDLNDVKKSLDDVLMKIEENQDKLREENDRYDKNERIYEEESKKIKKNIKSKTNELNSKTNEFKDTKQKLEDREKKLKKKNNNIDDLKKEITIIKEQITDIEKELYGRTIVF